MNDDLGTKGFCALTCNESFRKHRVDLACVHFDAVEGQNDGAALVQLDFEVISASIDGRKGRSIFEFAVGKEVCAAFEGDIDSGCIGRKVDKADVGLACGRSGQIIFEAKGFDACEDVDRKQAVVLACLKVEFCGDRYDVVVCGGFDFDLALACGKFEVSCVFGVFEGGGVDFGSIDKQVDTGGIGGCVDHENSGLLGGHFGLEIDKRFAFVVVDKDAHTKVKSVLVATAVTLPASSSISW